MYQKLLTVRQGSRHALLAYLICMMRIVVILLTVGLIQVSAATRAQHVTLHKVDADLKEIFTAIRQQTGYTVVTQSALLRKAKPVTIALDDAPLDEALAKILAGQGVSYRIEGKEIILAEREAAGRHPRANRYPAVMLNELEESLLILAFPEVRGKIVDSTGAALAGASIRVLDAQGKRTALQTQTDRNGDFLLRNVPEDASLEITYVGYIVRKVNAAADVGTVILYAVPSELEEVEVNFNTGYQSLSPERTTGSFTQPDKIMYNARVATDVISKLEGITSGVVFNAAAGSTDDERYTIRGRSTIYANQAPLIVVDNFPYDGDINNINPNDIENITILKDAAAASIWGARSGNGVIVITTKQGKLNQKTKISFNANTTVSAKPDLFYDPNYISTNEFIDLETTLYNTGHYQTKLDDPINAISPVVALLYQAEKGKISNAEAQQQINSLRSVDARYALGDYFYRNAINQQYALNFSGGDTRHTYYISGGYDRNLLQERGSSYDRITVNVNDRFSPLKGLDISLGLNYIQSNAVSDHTAGTAASSFYANLLPYTRFADDQGNALPVVARVSPLFTATAMDQGFLDWDYYPLTELHNGYNVSRNKATDVRLLSGIDYEILRGLKLGVKYQYQRGNSANESGGAVEAYETRHLINTYAAVDAEGNVVGQNLPVGGIRRRNAAISTSQNVRAQLDFQQVWDKHAVNVIAGAEAREFKTDAEGSTFYGYDEETGVFTSVDPTSYFVLNPSGYGTISSGLTNSGGIDRFRSFYANGSYTFNERYILSGSGRIDQSNLFGVKTNQKSVPLWSVGGRWDIYKEPFYNVSWIDRLSLRATYGYNGNMDKTLTAITTFSYWNGAPYTNLPHAIIGRIGNPQLRWETSGMVNLGLDFSLWESRLNGSAEFFTKRGKDLIGWKIMPTTSGVMEQRGNYSAMKGQGIDITLNSENIKRNDFSWHSGLLLSWATDEVTAYTAKTTSFLGRGTTAAPIVGYPVNAVYSFRWAGLNPETGAARGYDAEGNISEDYASFYQEVNAGNMDFVTYHGPTRPSLFGGLRNNFRYKSVSLSFNISYKAGYYFRRGTIGYAGIFNSGVGGHVDYLNRWKQPGDELHTTVPAMNYPANRNADDFYANSEALVEKGDHIRLQDISLSYDLRSAMKNRIPFPSLEIYGYANNIGILWKASRTALDPDYAFGGVPASRTFALGIRAGF